MKEPTFAALALTQSTVLFVMLLPDPDDLQNLNLGAAGSGAAVRALRTREGAAAALSLTTGLGLSLIGRDATPLLIAVISAATLIALSEVLIRTTPTTSADAQPLTR